MIPSVTCPDPQRLRSFLLGHLTDRESGLEQHLLTCDACLAAAQLFQAGDPLVEIMRGAADLAEKPLSDAEVDLLHHLGKVLHAPQPPQGLVESAGAVAPAAAPPQDDPFSTIVPAPPPTTAAATPTIPGYQILKKLGQGGMGIVYQARQLQLNRIVALKMIRSGSDASEDFLQRFLVEAEAIARLQHPNIVQIFESGEHEGRPYFTLEYVSGGSLEDKVHHQLPLPREAAHILEQLARGMAYAHAQNIIHRDLKPENVLLASSAPPLDGRKGEGLGLPVLAKITDFGLAKRIEIDSGLTGSGEVMGTPSYMAPEQALGQTSQIGPLADVYALGAILYRLLTGRPPFQAATVMDTLLQVVECEPMPPTRLQANTPRDLETICLKCLRKEPAKRYASAAALAEDLHAFLANRPIRARPVSRGERLVKWMQRRPAAAALMAVSVLALLSLLGSGTYYTHNLAESNGRLEDSNVLLEDSNVLLAGQVRRAEQAEKEARLFADKADKARKKEADAKRLAQQQTARARSAGHAILAQACLRAWEQNDLQEAERLLDLGDASWQQTWEARFLSGLCGRKGLLLRGPIGPITTCVALSGDGKRIVSGGNDQVQFWDVDSGKAKPSFHGHLGVLCVALSGDGKWGISGGNDNTVRVWDADIGKERRTLQGHTGVCGVAISGQRIVLANTDGTVRVWDKEGDEEPHILKSHKGSVLCLAVSADGKRIVSGGRDKTVFLWDLAATSKSKVLPLKHTDSVNSVAISGNGRLVVSGSRDHTVRLWDAGTGKERVFQGHTDVVKSVAVSADGQRIVSGSRDQTVRLWDAATVQEKAVLKGHASWVMAVALCADGRIVSADQHQAIRVWNVSVSKEKWILSKLPGVRTVAVSANGKRVVLGGMDRMVRLWDAETGKTTLLEGHEGLLQSVAVSHDGQRIVSGGVDKLVRVWDDGTPQTPLQGHSDWINSVAVSHDGQRIVSGSKDRTVRVWNAGTAQGKILQGHTRPVNSVALSGDGQRILSGGQDCTVRVWDAASGRQLRVLNGSTKAVTSVAFGPDGKWVAAGSDDKTVRLWDVDSSKELHVLKGHTAEVLSVAISGDGQRLISASADGTVRLWDVVTGQEMLALKGHTGFVYGVAFSADGRRIVSGGVDGTVRVWDASAHVRSGGAP